VVPADFALPIVSKRFPARNGQLSGQGLQDVSRNGGKIFKKGSKIANRGELLTSIS